jgi:Mrp family chromosome partitioning ATPase
MLDQMAEKYRYVLVDSAPLDLVSDGERIGSLCDGALLVVRAGTTPKGIVKKSVQQLERAGCPLLGIILNRVENYTGGYYNKRYGSRYYGKRYYGYGKRYYGYGKQYYGYGNEYYKKSKS